MILLLRQKLLEVLQAVAPLVAIVCLLQFSLVHAPIELFLQFLVGSALATCGILLLLAGIDLGVVPMGRYIGAELPKRGSIALIMAVAFSLGFAVTVAEPDVLVLAEQVDALSQGAMHRQAVVLVIALGVGLLSAAAMVRIITGWSMRYILAGTYAIVLVLSCFAPESYVPLAFDSGSVTTGVLSAPVMVALAMGLSSVLAGRSAVSDGFGLLGFASIGPIFVMALAGLLLS